MNDLVSLKMDGMTRLRMISIGAAFRAGIWVMDDPNASASPYVTFTEHNDNRALIGVHVNQWDNYGDAMEAVKAEMAQHLAVLMRHEEISSHAAAEIIGHFCVSEHDTHEFSIERVEELRRRAHEAGPVRLAS